MHIPKQPDEVYSCLDRDDELILLDYTPNIQVFLEPHSHTASSWQLAPSGGM